MKASPQRPQGKDGRGATRRKYAEQLTAWMDTRAAGVLSEMLWQIGLERGFECVRCHRPPVQKVQKYEEAPFHFKCSCGYLSRCLVWTGCIQQAGSEFEWRSREFQEAA